MRNEDSVQSTKPSLSQIPVSGQTTHVERATMWRKLRLLPAFTGLACLLIVFAMPRLASGQAAEWTWVGGPQTPSADGVYGQLGQANAANWPGARQSAPVWRDSSGNLWLFGGYGYDSSHVGGGAGPLNDLWMYSIANNEWTWVGGSSSFPAAGSGSCQPGTFGTQGTAASENVPGGNYGGQAWIDKSGNFWLFSGSQCDSAGNAGGLNDLWMYNPVSNEWTWVAGQDVIAPLNQYLGVYGTMGDASASNTPGNRIQGATWTDLSGKFWLFGGVGPDSVTPAPLPLNDLWMFDPVSKEWTWVGGPDTVTITGLIAGNPGDYAAQGSLNAGNQPGSRSEATTWIDSNGNLWMFGGVGDDSTANGNLFLNDLWMYSIASGKWNWVGGPSTVTPGFGMPGVYGTEGTGAPSNWPGGRTGASAWVDASGEVWLFGGNGYDVNGAFGVLNDMWGYNPSTGIWIWVAGSDTAIPAGVFGTEGTASAANIPPPRAGAMEWTDLTGNFWLFAGLGDLDVVNDLWRFNAPAVVIGTAATPTFSEPAGTYSSTQSVTLSDTTANSTIFYTTDGTTPTTSSTQYSGAISVTATETIEAIAVASGYNDSAVASATYTINEPAAATPVISPAAGTYTATQSVTITDSTAGAIIYYTTNGTTPTVSSAVYNGAFSVSSTETVEAIAVASGFSDSAVASAAYTINLPPSAPKISPAAGTYTSAQSVTITEGTPGAIIYYTTDGSTPTASSTPYTVPITVSSTETISAIAIATGNSSSPVATAAYTINLTTVATPIISPAAGTYSSTQSVTITDSTAGATIYYTTNGTTPTASSTPYTGAISVTATETVQAIAIASGFTNSAVASSAYTINLAAAATPVISPAAGTYTSTQSVTITDSTAGATIYYTTNGTTPTASSTPYTGAISVTSTETIEAIAIASGFSNSAVASAAYTINLPAATPVISPAAGTYTSVQSVTITDSTAGAIIYYTTNGTTPTASSAVYSGAISVSSTETIEAIAVATGFSTSAVASAAYTINLPAATPVISPAAGTYTSVQSVTITDSTAGAIIYYTTNGTTPTAQSTVYSGAISVSTTETIEAIAVAPGFTHSAAASAAYTINLPAATPAISPAAGTYTSVQSVTITDGTAGATIYYTTDGTTPTASSTVYSGAISVSATETIEAIAVAPGFSASAVASAAYTINLPAAATPVISPAAGTYTAVQSVTITDSTAGATIYYTTNGTTPTASSTAYSGAISVSSSETIEAIAVANGFSNSAAASAAYVISIPVPSFTMAANPSSLTIKSGSTGTTIITVTPTNGFTGTVNFSCGSLPTDATCSLAPSSVTVTSGGAAPTTTLTVGTNGTATASLRGAPNGAGSNGTLLPEIFVAMILLPLGFTRRILRARKTGSPWLLGLLLATASLAAVAVVGLAGCGGKSSTSTPPGSYSIVVTGTSGATTVPLSISVTVQ
jgi:N-acetylneuraminic acid mutarotase